MLYLSHLVFIYSVWRTRCVCFLFFLISLIARLIKMIRMNFWDQIKYLIFTLHTHWGESNLVKCHKVALILSVNCTDVKLRCILPPNTTPSYFLHFLRSLRTTKYFSSYIKSEFDVWKCAIRWLDVSQACSWTYFSSTNRIVIFHHNATPFWAAPVWAALHISLSFTRRRVVSNLSRLNSQA
jgi:hypothetical protein